ncbi:hypothetical protein LCGC14_2130380 [marine sediment metagenome]|uniref:Uncharacterized protein n=1 Tax=marine sediment metagenome TaxID=412755 RepID=A0A0F9GXT0_9ZZZZ
MLNIILAVKRIKEKLVLKATKKGIWEDFGQTEIGKLKDKYGYEWYGTEKEKKMAEEIDLLENWCMSFDDRMLEEWKVIMGI